MTLWIYNNSTENITSSNHCTSLQIGGDEHVSVETNLYDSTSDSYKRAAIEPIATVTLTALLRLTKIMTTIWEKKIK